MLTDYSFNAMPNSPFERKIIRGESVYQASGDT